MNSSASFGTNEEAILCLYHANNNVLREEAQTWLTQLQKSPQILDIVWKDLLPSKHAQVQFYGATILHSKLLNDWNEIPVSQYDGLRNRLLEAVLFFKDELKAVIDRLCISLAVFLLRTVDRFWPNAIIDLISFFDKYSLSTLGHFRNVSREKSTSLLLRILTVIPEELQTITMSINERSFTENVLKENERAVFAFSEMVLNESKFDILSQASQCSRSWLTLGCSPGNCDQFLDLLIRVVTLTCRNLEAQQCSSIAIEAISLLVCQNEDSKKVLLYLEKLMCLFEILASNSEITEDDDLILYLCGLFIDIGDNHIKMLIDTLLTDQRDLILKLLHVILRCSNAPGRFPVDEKHSIETLNFWFGLQEMIDATDYWRNEEILNIMKSFYKQLVVILIEKSMQPSDLSDWSCEDKNELRCYQQDIEDTFMSCYSMLNHEFLEIVCLHLEQALGCSGSPANYWRRVDSCLRAFTAISENAMDMEDPHILYCFMLLQKSSWACMNVQTSETVLGLIGSYAAWLCSHNEFLHPVLSLVFVSIANPQLIVPATFTLKDIARECKQVLSPFAERMANQIMELLKQRHVGHAERERIIFCLGVVISLLSTDTIVKYLRKIADPYICKIETLLSSPPNNPSTVEKELAECVGIFTQLFSSLLTAESNVPVYCLLDALLTRFRAILSQYTGDACMNSICVAIECAVRSLGVSCADLLPSIVDLILSTYSTLLNIPSLKLAKKLLKLFGEKSEYVELMSYMLRRICYLTLTTIRAAAALDNLSNYMSLYEHFNVFCAKVLKRNRKLFLEIDVNDFRHIFIFAVHTIRAQEVETVKSSASFLRNVIAISRAEKPLFEIVQAHGQELVTHILTAIGESSPVNCLEHVCGVLVELNKNYHEWLGQCLIQLLAKKDFPSAHASHAAKTRFVKSILENQTNEARVLDETKEFSFLCGGLLNEDYLGTKSSHSCDTTTYQKD